MNRKQKEKVVPHFTDFERQGWSQRSLKSWVYEEALRTKETQNKQTKNKT